jgi:hypothetical protein
MGALASLRLRLHGNTRLSNPFCYQPKRCDDEDRLTEAIVALASQYGRCGCRRITALLKSGWLEALSASERRMIIFPTSGVGNVT